MPTSPGRAARLLKEYEALNSDLPKETRRVLGCFAIAHKVGREALEELFGPLRGVPYVHRCWFYYNCLRIVGLAHLWDEVAERRNDKKHSTREIFSWIKSEVSEEEWKELGRRMGYEKSFRMAMFDKKKACGKKIWTRGGAWDTASNFTRIIIMGEHLDDGWMPREYHRKKWHSKLGPQNCRRLESELQALIDPETTLHPYCHVQAYEHIATRVPQLIPYTHKRLGPFSVSWFFGTSVYFRGKWWSWKNLYKRHTARSKPRFVAGDRDREHQAWKWL